MGTVRKRKSGRWQAIIRRKGHPSISQTFATKAAALQFIRVSETDLDRGIAPDDGSGNVLLKDLFDRYEREVTMHKKGAAIEKIRLKALSTEFGALSAKDLTAEHVSGYALRRLENVKSDTVRRDLVVLSGVIETARVIWGKPLLENVVQRAVNALTRTRTMKKPQRRIRRISDEELSALYVELSDTMRAIVVIALETAMRRGEIARAKWSDINGNTLTIHEDKSGNLTSTIPLSTLAMLTFSAVERLDDDSVFHMESGSISQAFKRACTRAKIKDLRFHDLRHEATSRLFEKGLSIEEVAAITRHSDWKSLKIYTHPSVSKIAKKLS